MDGFLPELDTGKTWIVTHWRKPSCSHYTAIWPIDRYEGSAACYVLKDMTLDNISLLALPEHRVRVPREAS